MGGGGGNAIKNPLNALNPIAAIGNIGLGLLGPKPPKALDPAAPPTQAPPPTLHDDSPTDTSETRRKRLETLRNGFLSTIKGGLLGGRSKSTLSPTLMPVGKQLLGQ